MDLKSLATHLEKVDLLINNASVFSQDTVLSPDYSLLDNSFKVHTMAPLYLSNELYGLVSSQKSTASIINICDYNVDENVNGDFFSYHLGKKMLWEITKTMALSYAPSTRVNAIGLYQALKHEKQSENQYDRAIDQTPLRRQVSIQDICNAIDFIVKTPSITGQLINLDSGMQLTLKNQKVNDESEFIG